MRFGAKVCKKTYVKFNHADEMSGGTRDIESIWSYLVSFAPKLHRFGRAGRRRVLAFDRVLNQLLRISPSKVKLFTSKSVFASILRLKISKSKSMYKKVLMFVFVFYMIVSFLIISNAKHVGESISS